MSVSKQKHVYLVEGSGFIFRAFHALPPLTRSDGTPVGAVYGFTNMLIKLSQEKADADYLVVLFDAARENFRHTIYQEYKANRPPPPPELIPQFPLIHQACEALNVPHLSQEGYEADDLIATYARHAVAQGARVTIVSSDKDLTQLVSDEIDMFDPLKNRPIGRDQVLEKFGVPPERVRDVQALAGDSSDNVPGVPGIGVKTAAELINQYGDLESLLSRAHEIPQPKRRQALLENQEQARLSYRLVTLKPDVPVETSIEVFARKPIDSQTLLSFLKEQGFTAIISRLTQNGLLEGDSIPSSSSTPVQLVSTRYELVQDAPSLKAWIDKAYKAGQVAVDTETDSLDPLQANLVGVSLSVTAGEACYIPLGHVSGEAQGDLISLIEKKNLSETIKQIPLQEALELLKPLLVDSSVLKIGQNIKYDAHVFSQYGLRIMPLDDTMVLSYLTDGATHGHGMDELAKLYLDHETIKYEDVCGKGKNQVTFDRVPLDKALEYAAEDADITLRLHQILKPKLRQAKLSTVYETMERPLIPVLQMMEEKGIKVDVGKLIDLSHAFAKGLANLEKEIHDLAGQTFNIASPKQLGDILFESLGLEGGVKGKTGAYGTSADVMERLSEEGHLIATKVLQWRQLSKLKSTYTDALVKRVHPKTGRVHTSYGMTIANTGRLSSSDPNLQNIPIRAEEGRQIRQAFVAEKGYKLVSLDYSQIELRLLSHVAGIDSLKNAFREGQDIHALTASQVFGIPVKDIDPETRSKAKAINFGIIYGISGFGLARQLGISKSEANAYIEVYFKQYPGIRQYMEEMKAFARQHGYVETLFGRRIFIPDINSRNGALKGFAERQAINAPLQGANADIIKRAMVRIPDIIAKNSLNAHLLLQVHDELVFEIQESDVERASHCFKKVMETAAHLDVPLAVDIGIGDNWDEAH